MMSSQDWSSFSYDMNMPWTDFVASPASASTSSHMPPSTPPPAFEGQSTPPPLHSSTYTLDGFVDIQYTYAQEANWGYETLEELFPKLDPSKNEGFIDDSRIWETPVFPAPIDLPTRDAGTPPPTIFIPPYDEPPQEAGPSQLRMRSSSQAHKNRRRSDGAPYTTPPTHSSDEQPVRRKRLKKANNQQQQQQQQVRRFRLHQGEAETDNIFRFEGNWTDDRLSSGVSPFERDDGLTPNRVRSGGRASGGVKRKRRARGSKMISMDDQITSTNLESTASNVVDTMEEVARRKSQSSTQQRFGSYTTGLVFRQTCFNADGSKNTIYS